MTFKNSLPLLTLLLMTGAFTASAQTTCTVTSVTTLLRGGGLTEPVGDITLTCSGGTPTAPGSPVPAVSIGLQIQGAIGVTNRVLATDSLEGDFTDALAIIDSPADSAQLVCVEPCQALGTGDGQVYDGSPGHPNVFQAHVQVDPSVIIWYGVPIDGGSHTIRLTNVRVAVDQLPSNTAPLPVYADVFTTPTNILASGTGALTVGIVFNALNVITPSTLPTFQGCVGQNTTMVGNPAASGTAQLTIGLQEQTVTDAFRPRTSTPFVDDNTSPAPTMGGEESGFVNLGLPVITGQGDLSKAGLADSGTRPYATFSNVPAGVHLFAPVIVQLPLGQGLPTGVIRMVAPNLLNGGAFEPVVEAPNGLAEFTTPSGGTATVVYEVLSSANAMIDTANIPIYVAYAPSNGVISILGPAQFSAGFGPISTVSVPTATDPIPRFYASDVPYNAFLIAACAPTLTISGSHSGNFAQGQKGAQYQIMVSNLVGAAPTSGTVTVTDTLPSGLTATAISGTGWTCTLSDLTCTRSDSLLPGASYLGITVVANVSSSAPSQVINSATVTGGGSPTSIASDPTTITLPCTFTVGPATPGSQPAAGGTLTLNVTTPAGCYWNASSGTNWITVQSTSATSGNGSATFLLAQNTGAARSGPVSLAGQSITIAQASAGGNRGDFDGNGVPDLVWQNNTTRQVTVNYYGGGQGLTMIGWNWLNSNVQPGWHVVAAADFDGNGVPDLVWQNDTTRQVTVNYYGGPQGATMIGWNWLNTNVQPGWHVVAAADFDGNGTPDLVWQNDTTRQVTVNYYGGAQGATLIGWNWLNSKVQPAWHVVAAADFDGNGVPDLVWQNDTTRQVTVNYYGGAEGASMIGWTWLNSAVQPGWSVVGAADFDGNGVPDLLWQNDATRQVTVNYYGGAQGAAMIGWNWLNSARQPDWTAALR
jgi:uncharacterized repeat protein (TIGR01451 family)